MRRRLSGRIGGWTVVVVAVAVALSSGSATASAGSVVTGNYAGTVDGAPVAVAVVAEAPAAEGQPRTVSMYVCNGTSLSVWLTGKATGNTVVLRSADRRFNARVRLAPLRASGVLAIPGGQRLEFSVARTANVAGLFDVTVSRAGAVKGTSTTGATLTGRVDVTGNLSEAGTVEATARGGRSKLKLTAPARHLTPGAYRWIVLSNGKVYGASKRGTRLGGIGGLQIVPGTVAQAISAGSAGQPGWGNGRCQSTATTWENLVDAASDAIVEGDEATADAFLDLAAGVLENLTDHCFVVGGGF